MVVNRGGRFDDHRPFSGLPSHPRSLIRVGWSCRTMPEENEIKALRTEINELRATVARLERVIDGLADVIRPPAKDLKQGRITRWMND